MPYLRTYPRKGVSDYFKTGDWSWMFYPPPYRFMNPNKAVLPSGNYYPTYAPAKYMGLGCAGDCGCGGACGGKAGMGAVDFSLSSTSIADLIQSYLPISSHFSIPNWALYGIGALLVGPKLLGGHRR